MLGNSSALPGFQYEGLFQKLESERKESAKLSFSITDQSLRWKIAPSVRSSSDRDGCVLLDTEKGVFYGANAVGSKIWELIRETPNGITAEALANRLASDAEIPREEFMGDLAEYLRHLAAQGLLIQE